MDTKDLNTFTDILTELSNVEKLNVDPSMLKFVSPYLDRQSPRMGPIEILRECLGTQSGLRLLDFGCGSAPHRRKIEELGIEYHGVDLASTTGYRGKLEADENITFYEGETLPFSDRSFDVVYSNQVFEHVLDPFSSMKECARVLRLGGKFAGAVSFLEPYHAYQTFSYTPYGFTKVAERAGLLPLRFAANRDVFHILLRKFQAVSRLPHTDSPLDYPGIEDLFMKSFEAMPKLHQASFMLQFCGSFAFLFEKPLENLQTPEN